MSVAVHCDECWFRCIDHCVAHCSHRAQSCHRAILSPPVKHLVTDWAIHRSCGAINGCSVVPDEKRPVVSSMGAVAGVASRDGQASRDCEAGDGEVDAEEVVRWVLHVGVMVCITTHAQHSHSSHQSASEQLALSALSPRGLITQHSLHSLHECSEYSAS